MSYATILGDIATLLGEVSGVGVVHDYSRFTLDWKKYITLFQDTDKKIRGWEISRGKVAEKKSGAYLRVHDIILRGHLQLEDANASDKTFQQTIDDVCAQFREQPEKAYWWYANAMSPDMAPCQVTANDIRLFGDVLCHIAEIHLSVTERIIP